MTVYQDAQKLIDQAPSVTDVGFWLEIRTYDGRLITQWPIPVGEDASEIDVNAEIAYLRSLYPGDRKRFWADAILDGDS